MWCKTVPPTTAKILGVQNCKPCVSGGAKAPLLETSNSLQISLLVYSAGWISNLGTHLLVGARIGTQWACVKCPRCWLADKADYARLLRDRVLLLMGSILCIASVVKLSYRFTWGQVRKWYLRVFACTLLHAHPYAHGDGHPQPQDFNLATAAASLRGLAFPACSKQVFFQDTK